MPRKKSYFQEKLSLEDLQEVWPLIVPSDRLEGFQNIDITEAQHLFLGLSAADQAQLILGLPEAGRRVWLRLLPPDDAADLIQSLALAHRQELLNLLDDSSRKQVVALLAYAEDEAGGLMNPEFLRLRPDMSVDEAISYLRWQTKGSTKGTYYAYVLNPEQHLLGVISFRELLSAQPDKKVQDIMHTQVITVTDDTDQEELAPLFTRHAITAIPVVDDEERMKGVVTIDDIVHVEREEATEDIQKMGGMEALDAPYLKIGFFKMLRKRAVWLIILFLSEMLTSSTLAHYESSIAQAVVLALFIPLIISSGGNSGSQASTLVIRAISLGEVKLKDWGMILFRELGTGLGLGAILGGVGFLRIVLWPNPALYGNYPVAMGLTIAFSLVGVVLWGTLIGAMLPFILRRLQLDPATASGPFVATIVDVSGLIIYFTMAGLMLKGTLL